MSLTDFDGARLALAINLELSHGRHGASARVEVLEHAGRRVARVGLSGWMEDAAMGRLERAVADLAGREVEGLILDCTRVRHVDTRSMPRLARAMQPFAARREGVEVLGLEPHLREWLPSTVAAHPSMPGPPPPNGVSHEPDSHGCEPQS